MTTAEALELLSLPLRYTAEELQQAWREAAKAAHPDAGGSDAAMAALNAARAVLERGAAERRAAVTPGHVLQISPDGVVFGPEGNRVGACGSVKAAEAFCRRTGWEYALSRELPLSG